MAKKPKININATFDYTHLIPTICLRLETEVPELKPIFFGDSCNLKKNSRFFTMKTSNLNHIQSLDLKRKRKKEKTKTKTLLIMGIRQKNLK